jgi:NADH-quinone oxidoreductase subunit A
MADLVLFVLIFLGVGGGLLFANLMLGRLVRPFRPSPEKGAVYECGEETIGSAWIQFDLRFYVVALLFVIFDVELAFFFPWAVVFGSANRAADVDLPEKDRIVAAQSIQPTPGPHAAGSINAEAMNQLAWVAFADILIFFGVLLVGFAYLWRRGDIDWVRSMTAERVVGEVAPTGAPPLPAVEQQRPLVGAGS